MALKSKAPSFLKTSKMKNYNIIFDRQVEQYRAGFYSSKFKDYKPTNKDTIFTVPIQYKHRLDLISYKFYGTAQWDWIIEDANNIKDPIKDIIVGKKLIIPDASKVYASKF